MINQNRYFFLFLCMMQLCMGMHLLLAETFIVTNTEDTGTGSLRQAITEANMHIGPDTISFNIPESGSLFNGTVWFIEPFSNLPALTDNGTVIDGTTQTASRGETNPDGPEVYVYGYQGRNGYPVSYGFTIGSSDNVVRGLIVSCFSQAGILLTSSAASYNRIEGNFIGLNFSGNDTLDSPNGAGIQIDDGAEYNTIGGSSAGERNIISGNRHEGVGIFNADSNRVTGNYIGTNAGGNWTRQNVEFGVKLFNAAGNEIGGLHDGEGNLISGTNVSLYLFRSDSNVIAGNIIGLDHTGTILFEDARDGIMIADSRGNRIGGSLPGERNIICGNGDYAVNIFGDKSARDNIIQGNFIGTDISGMHSLGNLDAGIVLSNGASANLIGGTEPGASNIISGHAGYGIYAYSSDTDSNQIIGNRIGTDITGNTALPNRNAGVCIYNGPKSNQIGPANVIRFNVHGILVQYETTLYNRITQNCISDNTASGIMFFDGANGGIAPPSLLQTASGLEGITVPNAVIEIFSDSAGQGRVYEGSATADATGHFSWAGTPEGPYVTVTATDPAGNTSEFSQPVLMTHVNKEKEIDAYDFTLTQNYPNPFNPITTIRFSLQEPCRVALKVFGIRGKEVADLIDGAYEAGIHTVGFDASGLSSGIYVYRIRMGNFTQVRKMVKVE